MNKAGLLFLFWVVSTVWPGSFCVDAKETISGSNVFLARGNGIALISGSGNIELEGTGFIMLSGDDVVEILEGQGDRIELEDGRIIYLNLIGKVIISGEEMEIECGGANIYLRATCNGKAVLIGFGFYRAGLKMGLWNSEGVEIELKNLDEG